MQVEVIYEDNDVLVINKPSGVTVFNETPSSEKTLADYLIEQFPYLKENTSPRHGIAHRLDKDTSGALIVAKSDKSLIFLQKQFKNRTIQKKYIALVVGNIKEPVGLIETLIGRAPKQGQKQRVFLLGDPGSDTKRQAITEYKVVERYGDYTLLEVTPKTGRKHQIRCHLSYIQHPIVGDKMYGFKRQKSPKGLNRHFLHAEYLKFKTLSGKEVEVTANLPDELNNVLKQLKKHE